VLGVAHPHAAAAPHLLRSLSLVVGWKSASPSFCAEPNLTLPLTVSWCERIVVLIERTWDHL
jgi:hypothetical protein